jgi:hypothetical protein
MRAPRACALLGLILLPGAGMVGQKRAAAPPLPTGWLVGGTVVRNDTHQPLNHVLLTISPVDRQNGAAMFLTGADGEFAFSNVPAGKYRLSAQKEGFTHQEYMSDGQYATAVVVGAGLECDRIVFPLPAPVALSGQVTDEHGEPVQHAQIHLLKRAIEEGQMAIRLARMGLTDLRGSFSLDGIEAGAYLIAVTGVPWYAPLRTSGRSWA